jgi:hypothetical protein
MPACGLSMAVTDYPVLANVGITLATCLRLTGQSPPNRKRGGCDRPDVRSIPAVQSSSPEPGTEQ